MTGVLLVNMGGANTPKELKVFLSRMFKDPFILPFGKCARTLLSFIISNTRYKKSWKKYELIGGSPIIEATDITRQALQQKLGQWFSVKTAFSYSHPLIKESIRSFFAEGIIEIIVIPLYPQAGYSTTSSVEKDVAEAVLENKGIKINFIKEFYNKEGFVNFWSELITKTIKKNNFSNPYLVFSAHSIPRYMVEKGDTYPEAIEASSRAIAKKTNCDFEVAYQSGMNRGKWIGPDVKESLKTLALKGKDQILIIPISFVNENLETLFDIDHEIVPFVKQELGIKNVTRVEIPHAEPLFVDLLKDLVETNLIK